MQVKQNTESIRNQTSWSITQGLFSINARESSDGEFTELWVKGLKDYESLDDVQKERFRAFAMDLLNLANYMHRHPAEEHDFYIPYVASLIEKYPGFRHVVKDAQWSIPKKMQKQLGLE